MRALRYWAVAAVALAACGGSKSKETGSVSVTISGSGLSGGSSSQTLGVSRSALTNTTPGPDSASKVAYIVLTHTGADGGGSQRIDTITNPVSVLLNALPVGAYSFSAIAYDASDVALFSSPAVAVNVYKNTVAGVNLILQQLAPPGTTTTTSPLITSILVSDVTPAAGETITLSASVLDNTDQLAYQWSSSCSAAPAQADVFSAPTSKTTSFTSFCTGTETITFSATETSANGGGTSTVAFVLTYSAQGANPTLVLNSWPDILSIGAPNRQPGYGATISLTATAQDPDGDALTFAWADTCGGTFINGTTLTPSWTAPAKPTGTKPPTLAIPCKLKLTVTDAKGGKNAGWLAINVGQAAVQTLVKKYALPRFAYVVNRTDSTVQAYSVNADTGALTAVGSPVATGTNPTFVTADPSGKFVYVTNAASTARSVSAFTVGADGALAKVGTDVAFTSAPTSVAIDPASKFAFIAYDSAIAAYPINPNTGELGTAAPTASVGAPVNNVAVDPSGRFLYAAAGGQAYAYSISATGALTLVNKAPANMGNTANAVAVDPSGRFVYATCYSGYVFAFSINQSTGALVEAGSVLAVANYSNPTSVAVDPTGKFVYTGNLSNNSVSAFAIDQATGTLTSLGAAVSTTSPRSIVTDPSGKFVYAVNSATSANSVTVFAIQGDGTLKDAGTPAATGALPYSIAMMGVYPPPVLYVANNGGWSSNGGTPPASGMGPATISAFKVDPKTGALTSFGAPTLAGTITYALALHPGGRFLYASDANNTYDNGRILVYGIHPATGALTALTPAPFPAASGINYPTYVRIHPSGKWVYACSVASRARDTWLAWYTVEQTTGLLTLAGTLNAGFGPQGMEVDPSGKFLLAGTNNGYGITAWSIDQNTGALMQSAYMIRTNPYGSGFAVDPFGRFIYQVTNNYTTQTPTGFVWAYTMDPTTGAVTLANSAPTLSTTPGHIAVEPSGRFAYVGDHGSNTGYVLIYSIDPVNGALTYVGKVEGGGGKMAFDPTGSFLYSDIGCNGGSNGICSVSSFAIDLFTGWLTPVGTVPTGSIDSPYDMVVTAGLAPWAVVTTTPATSVPIIPTFTVSGTVSGLKGTVVLQNNGANDLSVNASGNFTFATPVAQGSAYAVTVKTQPLNQTCAVANGAGTMGAANVSNVAVTCTDNPTVSYTIGGTMSGLYGTVVLQDNGADDLSIEMSMTAPNGNGSFVFATPIASSGGYNVTVRTQPAYQTCSVSNGTGTVGAANVTSVGVVCKGFGSPCTTNADCPADYPVCWNFPNAAPFPANGCTKSCSNNGVADATMCPSGSQGQKCNQQLVCRY